jgi:tRNA dimethylallyltransferase
MEKYLVVLCGPTGIGKTRVAIALAKHFGCEIISADSRQLFRELRIGTAVPSDEELASIPHHFIRSHSIHKPFNASEYETQVMAFLDIYLKKKDMALLAGGSGMYIDAVCWGIDNLPAVTKEVRAKWSDRLKQKGLAYLQEEIRKVDPEYFGMVDRNNPKRLLKALEVYEITGRPYSGFLTRKHKQRDFTVHYIGLDIARDQLYAKINERVDKMMHAGLLQEAQQVYPYRNLTPLKTVGYRELFEFLDGKITLAEATEQIKNHSRAYARRQLTWFRRYPGIKWFEPEQVTDISAHIDTLIQNK